MASITLPAHFDGEKIVLDEPYELQPNMRLTVFVQPEAEEETFEEWREAWYRMSAQGLARAYGDDEPEYTMADAKRINPDYRGPKI